jgi:hypothetical protein
MACRRNKDHFAQIAACFLVIAILGIAILRQQGSDNVISLGILVAAVLDVVRLLTHPSKLLRTRYATDMRAEGETPSPESLTTPYS